MKLEPGDLAWRKTLAKILYEGGAINPRSQGTLEILHHSTSIDMARAVVTSAARKLNYQFMCAEALWIIHGQNELAPLTKYVKRMAEFSDDGEHLAGAYGPKVVAQMPYIINALLEDQATRQAVLTIWERNPKPSKDIPCTVAMSFNIRGGLLHQHVYMRSSDAWLGLPYDMFSFSCLGLQVLSVYNEYRPMEVIAPGQLTITATSSHLYTRDIQKAGKLLETPHPAPILPPQTLNNWAALEYDITTQREGADSVGWVVVP